MTENGRGAALMCGSMAAFTLNDACLKWLAADMPTFQVVVLRGLATLLFLYALARLTGAWAKPVPRGEWPKVLLRSGAEVCAFLPFVLALTRMPLADITAILQAIPLAITATAALVLGERVGPRRWAAIGLGLAGVLLIVRPGAEGWSWWTALPVVTVLVIVVRDLVTRRLSPEVPSLKVAMVTAAGITGLGAVLSLREPWAGVGAGQGAVIVLCGAFILGGYLFSVMAMRVGEVAVVTPFRYTAMIWGLLLGWLVFGEWPDGVASAGAALVVAAGLYTLWREARVPMPRPAAPR